jgi:hypothetical protein
MTTVTNFSPAAALALSTNLVEGFAKAGLIGRIATVEAQQITQIKSASAGVSEILPRGAKKYIVPFDGKFYSYPLRVGDHPTSKDLFKMYGPVPNIYREGMIALGGEIYFVKIEDLKRGIVRKSRKLPIPAKRTITYKDLIDGLACTNFADLPDEHPQSAASIAARRAGLSTSSATLGDSPEGSGDQGPQGSPNSTELDEELRLANMAFEEQVGTLYDYEDSEEKWED